MKSKKIDINYNGKKISIEARICNWFWMIRGLMFTKRERAKALLLFDFRRPRRVKIHSYFVFFPFIAVWLDDKNRVIEKRIVSPFTFLVLPKKPFNQLIEVPLSEKYKKIFDFFDNMGKV